MSNFSKLKIGHDEAIAFDAAGALNQLAYHHAKDHLKGDYDGALKEWQTSLNHFVNVIGFKNMFVEFGGNDSQAKQHEHRHQDTEQKLAKANNNLSGQI
jgi:hypothetical protein